MSRQYSNKRSARQRGSAPHQFLVIIVTFLLGYLTASVFDVETITHWMNTQVLAHNQEKKQTVKAQTQQTQLPPKPKFEFYTLLANEKTTGTTQTNSTNTHAVTPPSHTPSVQTATNSASTVALAPTSGVSKTNTPHPQQKAPLKVETRSTASAPTSRAYMVQVASFKARKDAEHMKGLLTLKGFNVTVVSVSQPARGIWYRVIVGPYSNRVLAQKAQEHLAKNERLRGMITSAGG